MDADKIKEFFVFHFEKMILVVVIGVSGFLIYKGMQLPDFTKTQQPERLSQQATQVKSDIDENHNDAIIPPRNPTFDILQQTKKLYTAVEPSAYKLPRTWEGKDQRSVVRRQDPTLLPPRALITTPVVTCIAVRGSTTDAAAYPLASLEDAEPLERVEAPKPKQPKPRGRRNRGMMGEDMGMDDMSMMMEMQMMEDMSMSMESEMGPSMSPGGTRKFDSKFDFGMRPQVTDDKRNPEPALGWFIAGAAVVPHKELYEAYELAFKDADQYDPRRDTPFYYNLEVQRADVTDKPVDKLVDADWVKIWDRTLYTRLAALKWSGFAPEIVPEDYRNEALTMWIPPVLLDDYSTFATHPLVPMMPQKEIKQLLDADNVTEEIQEFSLDDDSTALVNPGQRSAGLGMGMDSSYDMASMGMEMDMEMDGMMMGMGMAMFGRGAIETDPVDYKLIRFYDFAGFRNSPQFGRKYVYRLRYAVNDPNFPFLQTLQPKTSSLSPDVVQRVQNLMAKAIETGERSFQKWSDWSEPSEPSSLPTLEQYFAGPVNPGTINIWKVAGKDVEYTRDPPTAKILASQYDMKTGARIPFRLDVTEGSVLSHKAESADVVDPITLKVKKLPDAEIVSGTTVVDLDGGAPLTITEGLTTPGLMLLFDQSGQLRVTDDVDDQEFYRIYSYADERGEE
jgi:hypothetical protein